MPAIVLSRGEAAFIPLPTVYFLLTLAELAFSFKFGTVGAGF